MLSSIGASIGISLVRADGQLGGDGAVIGADLPDLLPA